MTRQDLPTLRFGEFIRLVFFDGQVLFGAFRRVYVPDKGDALITIRRNGHNQSFGLATLRQVQEAR